MDIVHTKELNIKSFKKYLLWVRLLKYVSSTCRWQCNGQVDIISVWVIYAIKWLTWIWHFATFITHGSIGWFPASVVNAFDRSQCMVPVFCTLRLIRTPKNQAINILLNKIALNICLMSCIVKSQVCKI